MSIESYSQVPQKEMPSTPANMPNEGALVKSLRFELKQSESKLIGNREAQERLRASEDPRREDKLKFLVEEEPTLVQEVTNLENQIKIETGQEETIH